MHTEVSPPPAELTLGALRERARRLLPAGTGTAAGRMRWMLPPLLIALGTRVLLFWLVGIGVRIFASGPFPGILPIWGRKDALWYLDVAERGYYYSSTGQSSVNFFPLYPLLIRIVEPLGHLVSASDSYLLAGVAVSWVAYAAACVALYRLVLDLFGQRVAYLSVVLLSVFPFGLYYGTAYTESLYLFLTVSAFLAAERRQWWVAGAFAMLDGAERPPGLIVGACIAVAYLVDWWKTRHRLRADVLSLALVPLGAFAYLTYCWVRFHDPLAYAKTSWAGWHGGKLQTGGLSMFASSLVHLGWVTHGDVNTIIYGLYAVIIVAFCLLTMAVWRVMGTPYALYTLASVLLPMLTYPTIKSAGRYASVAFPVFIVVALGARRWPGIRDPLIVVSAALLVLFSVFFASGLGLP